MRSGVIECRIRGRVISVSVGELGSGPVVVLVIILRVGGVLVVIRVDDRVVAINWMDLVFGGYNGVGRVHIVMVNWVAKVRWVYFVQGVGHI